MGPDFVIEAGKLMYKPRKMTTPRPYLEGGKGEWRRSKILLDDGQVFWTPWENWAGIPEAQRYAAVPEGTRSMITVFGTPEAEEKSLIGKASHEAFRIDSIIARMQLGARSLGY